MNHPFFKNEAKTKVSEQNIPWYLDYWHTLFIIILFFLLFSNTSQGQTSVSGLPEMDWEEPELPGLDELLQLSLANAARLESQDLWIESKYLEWLSTKKVWADLINISGGINYGNNRLENISTLDLTDVNFINTTRRDLTYSLGVQIRINGGQIFKQPEREKIAKIAVERALIEKEEMENTIRQSVIQLYNEFHQSLEIMRLKAAHLKANQLAVEMAETYFKEGNLSPEVYTTALDKLASAEEEFIKIKSKVTYLKQIMEEIAGISNLYQAKPTLQQLQMQRAMEAEKD
ncbi:MAG: TolC family protein [Saprospiraceae bacterium]